MGDKDKFNQWIELATKGILSRDSLMQMIDVDANWTQGLLSESAKSMPITNFQIKIVGKDCEVKVGSAIYDKLIDLISMNIVTLLDENQNSLESMFNSSSVSKNAVHPKVHKNIVEMFQQTLYKQLSITVLLNDVLIWKDVSPEALDMINIGVTIAASQADLDSFDEESNALDMLIEEFKDLSKPLKEESNAQDGFTFPSHPAIGQRFTDLLKQEYIWTGTRWNKSSYDKLVPPGTLIKNWWGARY